MDYNRSAELLAKFPKVRAELSPDMKRIYDQAYKYSREGQSKVTAAALRIEEWMHRYVARMPQTFPVLELGAGTLNHLKFEPGSGIYDVVEPSENLYKGKRGVERVRNIYADISQVPMSNRYKRIISIAVLEHVLDLPHVIARTALLLDEDGEFRSGIPSEGGLLWYMAWRYGTGLAFWLRFGVSYKEFQENEHVNKAREIEAIIRLFYAEVEVHRFPLPFLHGSFYTGLIARSPLKAEARKYLDSNAKV